MDGTGASLVVVLFLGNAFAEGLITDPVQAQTFLDEHNSAFQDVYSAYVEAWWKHDTNITDYNKDYALNQSLVLSEFEKAAARNASQFDWKNFTNVTMVRQFEKIVDIGTAALEDLDKLKQLNALTSNMETIYSIGKVAMSDGRELSLEPGLTRVLASSRNYTELLEVWEGWRNATGRKMKDMYEQFVELSNEAIRANGFPDTGAYWRSWYESDTFQADLERLYKQLEPLYKELHIFTRRKLKDIYGQDKFPSSGHIPAHLLGNMWAQSWSNLLPDLQPYNKTSVDVTPQMVQQGYDALRMFNVSEEFFTSLGLIPMPPRFWEYSMIEKPEGREVVCHASAWDFRNQKDFRIKQCTDITMSDLITVHHEMGHIEYYLQYAHQPAVFRRGANPGFHEAVGDVLALSVSTPKHLVEIGLLDNAEDDTESDINYMLSIALDKIAFLPFGYLMDQWRWSVFSGETKKDSYNKKWWDLRCRYQGISPPEFRSEDNFDPGAKYHIPANTPYIRYFVSFVLQFQFHKALCQAASQTGPLHKCDIYRSREAGTKLSDVLKLGSSRPWQEVLPLITGGDKMDAGPIIEYFTPLINWLKAQNAAAGDTKGWDAFCPGVAPLSRAAPTSFSPKSIVLIPMTFLITLLT